MTSRAIKGVVPAIVTPITENGAPDTDLFCAHAEALYEEGAHALNVLGTTGEATSFSVEQRIVLMAVARARLGNRPMMVGTGAAAVADAVTLTKAAQDLGFDGALVLPPFYYKKVPEDGVVRYFDEIVSATEIPLYLYNFPVLSGVLYSEELVAKLIDTFGPRIAGLKDSSGDMPYATRLTEHKDFDVFPSNEACLIDAGKGKFAGCISATVNLSADLCKAAFEAGDQAAQDKANAVRAAFTGQDLVPTVKAVVARMRGAEGFAATKTPWMEAETNLADRLWAAVQDARG